MKGEGREGLQIADRASADATLAEAGFGVAAFAIAAYELRRSAVHVPEHAPPIQEPVPASPANRPEPVALLPAALTVTVMAPVVPTLPLTV
jgi:hypothetical protein